MPLFHSQRLCRIQKDEQSNLYYEDILNFVNREICRLADVEPVNIKVSTLQRNFQTNNIFLARFKLHQRHRVRPVPFHRLVWLQQLPRLRRHLQATRPQHNQNSTINHKTYLICLSFYKNFQPMPPISGLGFFIFPASFSLRCDMALAGFKCLGQHLVQLKMEWHLYTLK